MTAAAAIPGPARASPPFLPLYIADFVADTMRLSVTEIGAYTLLVAHYWRVGCLPVDDDSLAILARLTKGQWRKARARLALMFDEAWRDPRLDAARELACGKTEARREAGSRGGAARAAQASGQQTGEFASAVAEASSSESRISDSPPPPSLLPEPAREAEKGEEKRSEDVVRTTPSPATARELEREDENRFTEFWRAYPSPDPAALSSAKVEFGRLDEADQAKAIAGAKRYAQAYAAKPTTRPRSPTRFLAERGFDGYASAPTAPSTVKTELVFVKIDSPQWRAWTAHRGKSPPVDASGGWRFPSEWPPGATRVGAAAPP